MKDLMKYPLNIQLFAGETNEDAGAEDNNQEEESGEEATFTQADMDAAVAKEKARVKARYEKKNGKNKKTNSTQEDSEDSTATESQVNPYLEKYAQAEIRSALLENNVSKDKVKRAVRLIDQGEILDEDGDIDEEKLDEAIADLLEEWPELLPEKKGEEESGQNRNFKIGSDKNKDKGSEADLIAKAFGNTDTK